MTTRRVNTLLSEKLNSWLDLRSEDTGISKSSLIAMAVDNYKKEFEVVDNLPLLLQELQKQGQNSTVD